MMVSLWSPTTSLTRSADLGSRCGAHHPRTPPGTEPRCERTACRWPPRSTPRSGRSPCRAVSATITSPLDARRRSVAVSASSRSARICGLDRLLITHNRSEEIDRAVLTPPPRGVTYCQRLTAFRRFATKRPCGRTVRRRVLPAGGLPERFAQDAADNGLHRDCTRFSVPTAELFARVVRAAHGVGLRSVRLRESSVTAHRDEVERRVESARPQCEISG